MASKKPQVKFDILDPNVETEMLQKMDDNGVWTEDPLLKSIISSVSASRKVVSLAYDFDPALPNQYSGLFFNKTYGLPDYLIKRIASTDDLVATCVRARGTHAMAFGTQLQDRFSLGYRLDPKKQSHFQDLNADKKLHLQKKAKEISKLLATCGSEKSLSAKDRCSLKTFLFLSATNAVRFGRIATEIVRDNQENFQYFRARDPATVFYAVPSQVGMDQVRQESIQRLKQMKDVKIDFVKLEEDNYTFVQAINGTPVQVFTDKEMVVHNFYPITDVEMNGYPLTPIDTAINAILTHINITSHNKLYFQSGRASRGILVIQSEDINDATLQDLKQQFNAVVNNVSNSFRTPVFRVGAQDKVSWEPIDQSGRDMEFQYLADMNARVIMASFLISPDEIPGYGHLSKATNSKELSESNNEYKLEASRDVGLRPLISSLEDFFNSSIIPLFDEEVAEYFTFSFYGLEATTPEQEAQQQEAQQKLWGTFNDTLRAVDKPPLPVHLGGDLPLSEAFNLVADKYLTVGQILEHFFGQAGASKDPNLDYRRDQFWFSQVSNIQNQKAMEQQQQMAQQQAQQAPQDGQQDPNQPKEGDGSEIQSTLDQVIHNLSKSEKDLPLNKRKLLAQHAATIDKVMDLWDTESKSLLAEISEISLKSKK